MAEKLDVPVARITNNNPIRDVRRCVRDHYHASRHHRARITGLCGRCHQPLAACPPAKIVIETTLLPAAGSPLMQCNGRRFVCKLQPILHHPSMYSVPEASHSSWQTYCLAKANQLPWCGADIHKQCHTLPLPNLLN